MNKSQKNSIEDQIEDQVESTMGDVKSGYKKIEEKTVQAVTNAKDDVVEWAEEGVSKIKEGAHDFSENAKETLHKTTKSIDVNVKKYPWVAIAIGLLFGVGLGILLKPARHA